MSFGTIYGIQGSFRVDAVVLAAQKSGVKVDVVNVFPHQFPEDIAAKFPQQKSPAFLGADGFALTETIAIAIYLASQAPNAPILGTTEKARAKALQWASFANSELIRAFAQWMLGRHGILPYNAAAEKESKQQTFALFDFLNKELADKTYLAGDRLTIGDIFVASFLNALFRTVFTKAELAKYGNVQRYFTTMYYQTGLDSLHGELTIVDTSIPVPKVEKPKAEKPKAQKKAAAEKPKPAAAEQAAPKPKHPLAGLPNGNFNIEEFKRVYSNKDTRGEALPYFFDHFDPENYSVWKIDYAFPDDLKQPVFMTNNLIGGFFQRLQASLKFIFGCCVVIGENGDNTITGAFVIKGQDHVPAFDVAPDWESYTFTKLDASKPEDKAFIEDAWAWDKPIAGREVADGKVCK
ncbi:translation elongation factor EF-1 gamma subunit [Schizosaccharomyces japonicus yFS275]|uniref:Translation elongation factor EF-1 gamma subunit n=1 Tax=Schizosaccharomyces japonicus (strain yFS275 / FY16936) TaxID=402676 RepID=B6JZH7_SCHJY|nr:translation elongation factor EF-1 gamma subunit [Schizosaccharomyces japonicus yFS275]EEB06945.1 translation elongation factor EF-1 gamma subunit [Schizosaccharomyces japonicus yFS275]